MVDLKVNYLGLNQTLRMPTSVSEVDMNVISDYVKHVNVSKNYALIAVVAVYSAGWWIVQQYLSPILHALPK